MANKVIICLRKINFNLKWSNGHASVNWSLIWLSSGPIPLVEIPGTRPKYWSAIMRSFSAEVCPGSMTSLGVAGGSSWRIIKERKLIFNLYLVTSAAGSSSSLCRASG